MTDPAHRPHFPDPGAITNYGPCVYRVDADQDGFTAPLAYVLDPDEAEAIAATVPDNRGTVTPLPLTTLAQWQQVMDERRQRGH